MGRLQDCWLLISPFGGFRVYGIQPKSSGLQTVSKFAFHCRRRPLFSPRFFPVSDKAFQANIDMKF